MEAKKDRYVFNCPPTTTLSQGKLYLPQMPFCESHLHHSFLPLHLQSSWAFLGSYIQGLRRKRDKPSYTQPPLSIDTFYCNYHYYFLSFSLYIISNLFFHLQLGLRFFHSISKFCSWICGFGEEVEKGFSGFLSIFCLYLSLSLKGPYLNRIRFSSLP